MTLKKATAILSTALCACLLSGCTISISSPPASSSSSSESSSSETSSSDQNAEDESASTTLAPTSTPPADANESNKDAEQPSAELLGQQAVLLTEQIVDSCLQTFDENIGITSLNTREIFNFICTISKYDALPYYPYATVIIITEPDSLNPNLVAHISEEDAQSIAYQLFGVTDWFYEAPDCYDETIPEYHFNLEAGMPTSPYSIQEATAESAGDSVIVSFRLTDSDNFAYAADEQRKDFGQFQANYTVMSEENQTFLRFNGLSPTK